LSSCFTAGGKNAKWKKGKAKGKSKEKHRIRGAEEDIDTQTPPHARKNGRNGTKQVKKKLYYAELGASCL
jgi:hypothetical protein